MEELKILNIYELIFLKKAKFMFKISQSLTPEYINEMSHTRPLNNTLQSLRSSTTINYVLPRPHKELFKQSLIYSGPLIWNILVCVEVLRPSQPNGVMSSTVSLPNHTFTGQA